MSFDPLRRYILRQPFTRLGRLVNIIKQAQHTLYSAALSVVGMAICRRNSPPSCSRRKNMMAFEASMGEPPPTETMISAPDFLNASAPA